MLRNAIQPTRPVGTPRTNLLEAVEGPLARTKPWTSSLMQDSAAAGFNALAKSDENH